MTGILADDVEYYSIVKGDIDPLLLFIALMMVFEMMTTSCTIPGDVCDIRK